MKILRKQIIYRYKQIQHLKNERDVLKNVQHPGIVRLYATFTILHFHFCDITPFEMVITIFFLLNRFSTFRDDSNIYFLMEYVPGGELFMYIRRLGKLDERMTCSASSFRI